MSKTTSLYHIVFSTKYRQKTIPQSVERDVYTFIWSCIKEKDSHLLRIGGMEDHIHLLVNLSPRIALADFVRHVKAKSSGWMRLDERLPDFKGWSEGYYASSISPDVKMAVIEYINGQKVHHRASCLNDELQSLCRSANLEYDPRDMQR